MALVSVSELQIGQRIQFKTLSDSDNVLYVGTITAIGDYSFARTIADLLPYSQAVLKSNPDLDPLEELTFLRIEMLENSEQPSTVRVFAREWIDISSLKILEAKTSIDIRIYGTTTDQADTIVQLLRSSGYTAKLVSDS